MKITSITINRFRAFQENFTFQLAEHVTCISGHNGTGKSTILAILSNCCELKSSIATHLNGSAFRGDFSDIVVGDKDYDSSGDKVIVNFKGLPFDDVAYVEELHFRATFQTGDRYRLIPKKIKEKRNTEQKIKHPSYYLGLSRLYPVGESKKAKASRTPKEYSKELISIHEQIMSQDYGENTHVTTLDIMELPKKKLGIKNDIFSPVANSSGQDNLGQIILTILSFKQLRLQLESEYTGGLVLIDELDATLHPAAQNKLFDYLYQQAKELDLQVVFTTHSLSLLEHISNEIAKENKKNGIKISYLRKRDGKIDVKHNPEKAFYRLDLTNTYLGTPQSFDPIFILTEDEVARWFLSQILDLEEDSFKIKLLDINISWSHIINLITSNLSSFQNHIVILDPDLKKQDNLRDLEKLIEGFPIKIDVNCADVLILPSSDGEKIEDIFWNYLSDLPAHHAFFDYPEIEKSNWNKNLVLQNGPNSLRYQKHGEKIRTKYWFKDNQYFLSFLFHFWVKDNRDIVDNFIKLFKSSYYKKYNKSNKYM